MDAPFTDEQKEYLAGFIAGAGVAQSAQSLALPVLQDSGGTAAVTVGGSADIHRKAQDATIAAGGKLCKEEVAKREKNPFDSWDEIRENAAAERFPKGTDVFLYKFHGLFFVAPAQNSFMCRLRFPGGILPTYQFRGIADVADQFGGGYTHVTTRANLQIREIEAGHAPDVLTGLQELGVTIKGSGGDNIRNITGSPTAGIDPDELIDTRRFARDMHHHILNHGELYGLPRKFNIAFDGGGSISSLADTNDVGFAAVAIEDGVDGVEPGVYFRLELGGITGHRDFTRDTGYMVRPDDAVKVADAIIRVFIESGDRTNRNKARLKYVLDDWGFERFIDEVRKHLEDELIPWELDACSHRIPSEPLAHLGVHAQSQPGKSYIGVVTPVGKLTTDQMRFLADTADRYGRGEIRLTVWQNLLITDIDDADLDAVKAEIESAGLDWRTNNVRAGLVACTGNGGCKFAASDTKQHAIQIAEYVESQIQLDQPVNIHVTGCHHSCAQHYIGDIGLIGTNIDVDDEVAEGYNIHIGGGYGENQGIGSEIYTDVTHTEAPQTVERILRGYLVHRRDEKEPFVEFARRHDPEQLRELFGNLPQAAACP